MAALGRTTRCWGAGFDHLHSPMDFLYTPIQRRGSLDLPGPGGASPPAAPNPGGGVFRMCADLLGQRVRGVQIGLVFLLAGSACLAQQASPLATAPCFSAAREKTGPPVSRLHTPLVRLSLRPGSLTIDSDGSLRTSNGKGISLSGISGCFQMNGTHTDVALMVDLAADSSAATSDLPSPRIATPEPRTLFLLGTALVVIAWLLRREITGRDR